MKNRHLVLSAAIAMALFASGCGGGGGGGGVKDTPPVPPPPPTDPNPPGDPDPGDNPGDPDPGDNPGDPDPGEEPDPEPTPDPEPVPDPDPTPDPTPGRYTDWRDNILVPANADLAHERGFTGKGAKIGLLDDMHYEDRDYPALDGKVTFYGDFTDEPGKPDDPDNEKSGHGTVIAASLVGNADGDFRGGIAPDAELYWGRICHNDACWSDAAARAMSDMLDHGVRLFNLSIGGFYGDDEEGAKFSSAAWASAAREAVDAGSLLVFAAGNDGQDTASFPGAAPIHQPELIDNWLVVPALSLDEDGNYSGLTGYSNACGEAANWCVGAVGGFPLPPVPGTNYQGGAAGTSMATGLVTGVAALVSGAYPWMDGSNLQQTLLTTATDLGAPGVDEVYGWGGINADKAVRGPGSFFRDFHANVTSGAYSFSNDIGGEAGLIKSGDGTLILEGNNTYWGITTIEGGVLGVAGDTSSNIVVDEGGTFAAMGGKLGGNYTAREGSTTGIALGNPLVVKGTASLDGTLHLAGPNDGYTVVGRESLIEAGVLTGTFDDTTYAGGFFWSAELDYTSDGLFADLVRTSGAASAASAGRSQAVIDGADQLDTVIGEIDGAIATGRTEGMDTVIGEVGAVMNAPGASADASLASLTGQAHGTARTLGVSSVMNTARVNADRLPHLAGTQQRTTWASATHIEGDLDRSGYASASYRQDEFTVGVDIPVGEAVVGGSLTHGDIRADIDGTRDAVESRATGATLYGIKPMGEAYVSGVLGYVDTNVDTRRDIAVGANTVNVLADRDESAWHARIETGYNFDSGLTPFVAVGGIEHKQEAFAESGDTSLGLVAGSDTLNLAYADLGLRHRFVSNAWTFDSLVAYRNVFDGDDTSFDAWFNGLEGATFTIDGQPVGKEAIRAMLGVTYAPTTKVSVFGNVGTEKVSGQQDNTSVQLGIRVAF